MWYPPYTDDGGMIPDPEEGNEAIKIELSPGVLQGGLLISRGSLEVLMTVSLLVDDVTCPAHWIAENPPGIAPMLLFKGTNPLFNDPMLVLLLPIPPVTTDNPKLLMQEPCPHWEPS